MPSSISISTLSAITAAAGIAPVADWSKLTVQQINAMIKTVQDQINANNTEISNLTSSISVYDYQINTSPGYQKLFNDADYIYNSTLKEYIRVSSLVQTNTSTFADQIRTLSSFSTQAAGYRSTLDAARRDYSTLLSTAGMVVPLIQTEASTLRAYQSTFNTLSSFCGIYSPSFNKFMMSTTTLTKAVGDLQSTLTQIGLDYTALSTQFIQNPTDRILSTNVQVKLAEQTSLNQNIENQRPLLNATLNSTIVYSTIMGGCDTRLIDLTKHIQQTSTNINMYVEISTGYSVGSPQFVSQYQYWSTMEVQAVSTVDSYMKQRSQLIQQRDSLNGEITTLRNNLRGQLSQLDTAANTFYSKKLSELQNEVLEFQNASRECNAYTGLLTAQMMYKKLELFDTVDALAFYIQSTVTNTTLQETLQTQQNNIIADQTSLQTQVDRLNPIDVKFMELDGFYTNEFTFKTSFLNLRSTLHAMERNVIANPTSRDSIKTTYEKLWGDMNTAINSANTQIRSRQTKWNEISSILDTVKNALKISPLDKYASSFDPFITFYPYTYNQIAPQDATQTITVISEYALLPAIDFTKPMANYTL